MIRPSRREALHEIKSDSSRHTRLSAKAPPLKHVALVVESAVAPRRMMLTGVARYIQEHQPWAVYLKPVGVDKSLANWLQNWDGDGIIAAVTDPASCVVTRRGLPVVDVVGVLRYERVPLVHTNDHSVGRLGAEHLLERGFRNFGFCEYQGEFWSQHRREGFVATLKDKSLTCHTYAMALPGPGWSGPDSWEQQQRAITVWLKSLPKSVGIMATNDLMGQQLLEACQRARIKVPEEIAVVGADDDEPICRIASPPLSSVIINDHQRGYEAAALLDRMMNGAPAPKDPIYVEPTGVRTRASTDFMAIDDVEIVNALRILRENACSGISVEEVVDRVALSRSVLERRFRKFVGHSVNDEIVRLRINCAIELLSETELALKAVAKRAGFGSQSYMSAVFQSKVGKTPGSFRRTAAQVSEEPPKPKRKTPGVIG